MVDVFQPMHIFAIFLIFLFPALIIGVIPFWFICKKAGFSPVLCFLNLIPFGFGTLILVYILAFANWNVIPASQAAYPQPPQPTPFPQS